MRGPGAGQKGHTAGRDQVHTSHRKQTRSPALFASMSSSMERGYYSSRAGGFYAASPGAVAVVEGSSYPSSAPDTMCSSLMSWMLSMEPLEKGTMRGVAQPHPQPMRVAPSMPGAAGRLTGGRRRQAGTPRGSSTHARSRPGPRQSRSTPCSEHPVQPQHPGARSWRGGQREDGVTREPARTHPRALCLRILTASPRRSSPPHSTPSQSGRGTCCRAGGCLCGMPAPKGAWKEGKRNLDYSRRDRGQAQGGRPEKQVTWHRKPAPIKSAVGLYVEPGAHLPALKQVQTSQASLFLGKLDSVSPSSSLLLHPVSVLFTKVQVP